MKLKLYLISQDSNNSYDTYDKGVVCCRSRKAAKNYPLGDVSAYGSWVIPELVKVEYIGKPKKGIKEGLICASFHAG